MAPDLAAALGEMAQLLGPRLSRQPDVLLKHASDASHHIPCAPQAVAFPQNEAEVARLVTICARHRLPIIPFGTGTAVEGGIVAVDGGLCIDLSRLNRILQVSAGDRDATVEAGVTRNQLNRHLQQVAPNLYFPVDPGADASLGGMAATRASGSAALGYGTMADNVLALNAVMADGSLVRVGSRAPKSSAGYDLTHLLVGSEGTLGIITALTLRLALRPAAVAAGVCPFPSVATAVEAAIALIGAGVNPARLELLDEIQIDAVNRYSGLDHQVTPTLFVEFHGSPASVEERAQLAAQLLKAGDGFDFSWSTAEEERNRLWQARYDAYYASLALRPGGRGYVTDVCVPVSQLATAIGRAKEDLRACEIPAPLFGHVGDGNFHVVFVIDPNAPKELAQVQAYSQRLVDHALALGGTCSGEHGIGLGKIDALKKEAGPALEVMASIKKALDPHHILNPGKILHP